MSHRKVFLIEVVCFLFIPFVSQGRDVEINPYNPLEKQFIYENTTYIVKNKLDLKGKELRLPKNTVIEFKRGRFVNGIIRGNRTSFIGNMENRFKNVVFSGTFIINEVDYSFFVGYSDDTILLQSMFDLLFSSINECTLKLEPGRIYNINGTKLNYGHALFEYANVSNKVIEGAGATVNDMRQRSLVGFKSYDGVLLFSHCSNITINNLNYQNLNEDYRTLYDDEGNVKYKEGLNNQIGYVGTSFILIHNNCRSFHIKTNVLGARYGVKVGDYSQPWLSGDKGLTNSTIDVSAYKTGYPVAIELGDSLIISIQSDTHHRAAYLCGLSNSTVYIEAKNIYIAPLHCVFSDTHYAKLKGSPVEYKPCYNINAIIKEMGSEVVSNKDAYCVGFQTHDTKPFYERRNPLEWHDINVEIVQTKQSDNIGLFSFSRGEPINDRDPFNIKDIFQNISISAHSPFSSKQYSARIRTGSNAIYKNISIAIDAPKGSIIVDNLNAYQFDISSSKIDEVYHYGKVAIPKHVTHRTIKSTLKK